MELSLPQNLNAEQLSLGGILTDEAMYATAGAILTPDDFSLEKHRRIFRRMADLHTRGEKIDRVTLANELMRHGELESCDGIKYLVSLDDGLPQIYNLESYFRIVKDKSLLRGIISTAEHMQNRAKLGAEDPEEILSSTEKMFRSLSETAAERHVSRVGQGSDLLSGALAFAEDRKNRWMQTGKPVMGIETGIERLDDILGGLNPGLHLLGGGPGVGKTSLSLQIAITACRHGSPAVYVTYENSPQNLMLKAVCGYAGIPPRSIERGEAHSGEFERFRQAAGELAPALSRLSIIEGSMSLQFATIERAAMETASRHGMCLLVFDYLQRAAWGEKYNEVRHNVSSLASKLRDVANRLECPVLALSSQNRASGGYGKGGGSSALDSLKESGDLEYSADTVMFLLPNEETQSIAPPARGLKLSIAKNRPGELAGIPMIFRPDLGTFRQESSAII